MASKIFNSIQVKNPDRNLFNLSHDFKFSGNMGNIIPTLVLECIPGDKFRVGCKTLTRFLPMVSPVMHRMDLKTEYYFVPNRLVWPNWEKFIVPGAETPLPAFPTWRVNPANAATYSKLLNYMGIPDPNTIPGAVETEDINAIPMAAYQMIYNEYYRNQDLDGEVPFTLSDGNNVGTIPTLIDMRVRGWAKDYFTSALPTAQAGAAVDIPLGDVVVKPTATGFAGIFRRASDLVPTVGPEVEVDPANSELVTGPTNIRSIYDPNSTLEVDPVTISSLRNAFRLQEWLERAMRGGKRYVESIWSFFKVKSPDARLQRPEWITGVKTPVQISEVLNTTGTEDLPQGNMAGHGIVVLSEDKYGTYYCQEHGFVIGVMSVVPAPSYMQGIPKFFKKIYDPYQYYWEQFANIGEQEIKMHELYAYDAFSDTTFGYTPRYIEYKQQPNRVAGQLQTTLKHWSLVRIFDSTPVLNSTFVHIDPATTDRIFAVVDPAEDKLIFHVHHQISASRQMAIYGNPHM